MKKLLFFLISLTTVSLFITCESPSKSSNDDFSYIDDSRLSEEEKQLYTDDAYYLAASYMNQDSELKEQVMIPEDLFLKFYGALISVRNSGDTQAQKVHGVHDYFAVNLNYFGLRVDTSVAWAHNWQNNDLFTGDNVLDTLITTYIGDIIHYYSTPLSDYFSATLETKNYYNRVKLGSLFENSDQAISFDPYSGFPAGDGSTISASLIDDWVYITYSIGSGDCPAGCISRHYWEFVVKRNNVMFLGEYGD